MARASAASSRACGRLSFSLGVGRPDRPHDHTGRADRDRADNDRRGPCRVAPNQAPGSTHDPRAPRSNRLTGQVALEILGQRGGARVAISWILFHALETDGLQVARNRVVMMARCDGLVFEHLPQHAEQRTAERELARQGVVEDHAQPVNVGPRVDQVRGQDLLTAHELRRPRDLALSRDLGRELDVVRQAEISDLGPAAYAVQEDVGGLDIAVHDVLLMGRAEALRDLPDDLRGLAMSQSFVFLSLDAVVQSLAVNILHDKVRHPFGWIFHRDDLHDVFVSDREGRPTSAQESRSVLAITELGSQDLDRDIAPIGVDPSENDGRAAPAHDRLDTVPAQ